MTFEQIQLRDSIPLDTSPPSNGAKAGSVG
jgi:hypothetical protein